MERFPDSEYSHISLGLSTPVLNLLDGLVVVLLVDVHADNVASQGRILQGHLLSNSVSSAGDQDDLVLHGDRFLALDGPEHALEEMVRELGDHDDEVNDQLEDLAKIDSIFVTAEWTESDWGLGGLIG